MKEYVLGFLFNATGEDVVLIRKTKPAWQAGKLNGVGGKIEEIDATTKDAMIREFREETGVTYEDWKHFGTMYSPNTWAVHLYKGMDDVAYRVETVTDEEVDVYACEYLPDSEEVISNLKWLIPVALDKTDIVFDATFPTGAD
jgi:8-oxo-dGTP diphosphatase